MFLVALGCGANDSKAPAPSTGSSPERVATAAAADRLVGLWKARRWFGPEARGPLVVRRSGSTFSADMLGRILAVGSDRDELTFALPNGQGSFRSRPVRQGPLAGHWFPPRGAARGAVYASPVELAPDGEDRWTGQVVPFEETFTLYLMISKRPDGALGAFLRNPERNYGVFLDADRLVLDGTAATLFGKRLGDSRDVELARGTYDAGRDRIAIDFARGGTYDFTRDGDDSDFYPRGKNPAHYAYRPPLSRDDGWPTATLDDVGIDRAGIESFIQRLIDMPIESVHTPQVEGVLIARRGKLVLEEYFHGEHRDKLHETRSAAKSLVATMVGAAMKAGTPLALSTPVYQLMNGGSFPAGLDPQKRAMTLEHLLTMSSGYFCDDANPNAPGNENTMQEQDQEPDYHKFTLALPMAFPPGQTAVYCSANPNLALGVLARATGESALDTFDRLLGAPMRIRSYGWFLDPLGRPYGGGSVFMLPRDFMKLGQLMLDGGAWQGRQILDRDFVTRASAPRHALRNIKYGYLWWGIDYPYKDRSVHAFFAGGNGGQLVMVIPELDLVIAIYAGNYSDAGTSIEIQQNYPPRYILPAVREQGDDRRAPVVPRDFVTPYGRSPA